LYFYYYKDYKKSESYYEKSLKDYLTHFLKVGNKYVKELSIVYYDLGGVKAKLKKW